MKGLLSLILAGSLAWSQQTTAQLDDLKIAVIEGEDGANIVSDQTFAATVVEVRDKNNLPIAAGVAVTFVVVWALTRGGPETASAAAAQAAPGTFANGTNTVTVITGADGRAAMTGFHPSGEGAMQVKVEASYQGRTVSTSVQQTNFPTTEAARAAGKTPGTQSSNASGETGNQASNSQQGANGNSAASAANQAAPSGAGRAAANAGRAASSGGGGLGRTLALVASSTAAAGSGYYYYNQNQQNKCTSQENSMMNSMQSMTNACTTNSTSNAAMNTCLNAWQAAVNSLNAYCGCAGGIGDQSGVLSAIEQGGRQLGRTVSLSSCR